MNKNYKFTFEENGILTLKIDNSIIYDGKKLYPIYNREHFTFIEPKDNSLIYTLKIEEDKPILFTSLTFGEFGKVEPIPIIFYNNIHNDFNGIYEEFYTSILEELQTKYLDIKENDFKEATNTIKSEKPEYLDYSSISDANFMIYFIEQNRHLFTTENYNFNCVFKEFKINELVTMPLFQEFTIHFDYKEVKKNLSLKSFFQYAKKNSEEVKKLLAEINLEQPQTTQQAPELITDLTKDKGFPSPEFDELFKNDLKGKNEVWQYMIDLKMIDNYGAWRMKRKRRYLLSFIEIMTAHNIVPKRNKTDLLTPFMIKIFDEYTRVHDSNYAEMVQIEKDLNLPQKVERPDVGRK